MLFASAPMLVAVVGALVLYKVRAARLRAEKAELGWMGDGWLAEHRASRRSSRARAARNQPARAAESPLPAPFVATMWMAFVDR